MSAPRLSVLHVVSELYPFVKTGGLADVAAALPAALRAAGVDARVVVPGYPRVLDAMVTARTVREEDALLGGGAARLLEATLRGLPVPAYVVDCPGLYRRDGGPYQDTSGKDFTDNAQRFAALGLMAQSLVTTPPHGLAPPIVHAHDWQAGLAVAYTKLRAGGGPPCITTIHNIAYAGAFEKSILGELSLPEAAYSIHGVEFFGRVSFLKAGLYYADRITTVSPSYAREIQMEGHGGGFEGLLQSRARELSGILNGVDYAEWNPSADRHLPREYDATHLAGKASAKSALQERLGLARSPEAPLFGLVSRLVWQKGIDWVVAVLPRLVAKGAQLAVLGSGDAELVEALQSFAALHRGQVAFVPGYDEELAHLIQGGSDSILVPSRTEPCGLTQLYAQRYGSPPVVRRTGGLSDTVVDLTPATLKSRAATGFTFDGASAEALEGAIDRAIALFGRKTDWRRLQQAGMAADFGWSGPARRYAELYEAMWAEKGRG